LDRGSGTDGLPTTCCVFLILSECLHSNPGVNPWRELGGLAAIVLRPDGKSEFSEAEPAVSRAVTLDQPQGL
jgi:hypothetical protein